MSRKFTLALSLFALLLLAIVLPSCSEDVWNDNGLSAGGEEISFTAAFPGVESRSDYDVDKQLLANGFTVSAFWTESIPPAGNILPLHFEDQTVKRQVDGIFRSNKCRWPRNTGDMIGHLKFFAFHPSRDTMMQRAAVGKECFIYSNQTTKNASGITYDYRLTKFRVAPDISRQVDFVTATGEGNKTTDLYRDIKIQFEHQLSGVEIGVWGGASLYDIEVAGVRIGEIVIEADFGLSALPTNQGTEGNTMGEWYIPDKPLKGYVDYVFTPGDKIVRINTNEHNTKEKAVSIMGNGGKAMMIPQKQEMWDHYADKATAPKGMYFSALVRITQHDGDHHRVYPSTDPESQDYIVYLSVRKEDGEVMKRLDKYGNVYGTTEKYDIPDTEELRHYGWAAAPATVDWKPGYTYRYVLDYTNGVGVHDPYDLNPGGPMIDWGGVTVTTTTGEWNSGGVISEGSWGANTNNTAPDGTVWWK